MLPVAQFVARQVGPSDAERTPIRRTDVRRRSAQPVESELEAAAIDYVAALPRRRRLSLVLRAPSVWR